MERLCPRCPPLHAPCPRAVTPLNTLCSKLLFQAYVAVPEVNTPVMLSRAGPSHGEQIAICALCTPDSQFTRYIWCLHTCTYIHLVLWSLVPAQLSVGPSSLKFLGRHRGPSVFVDLIEMLKKKMFFEQSKNFFVVLNYGNINWVTHVTHLAVLTK